MRVFKYTIKRKQVPELIRLLNKLAESYDNHKQPGRTFIVPFLMSKLTRVDVEIDRAQDAEFIKRVVQGTPWMKFKSIFIKDKR